MKQFLIGLGVDDKDDTDNEEDDQIESDDEDMDEDDRGLLWDDSREG